MAESRHITRRSAIVGFAASVTTVATVATANAVQADLSPPAFDLQAWLDEQTPAQRANYHQTQLAMAMCELSPGKWRTAVTEKQDFVIVVRDEQTSPERASVFVQYLY